MTIDLARLCEAMRDRMYAERGGDLSPPALLESLLDAAATELRRQREEGAAEDVESVSVLDVLSENATLRSRVAALTAEVEGLKSSERERLIAEMVSELHHAGPYTALGRFIVHERARLKAQEQGK